MKKKRQSFLELAEDIFYNFSQIKLGSLNLVFSKKTSFPVIKYDSELEIIIPLPRKRDNKYLFEGMLFDNDSDGRKNVWCLFLATIYHLAAHACVSRYSVYESWKKSKTEDVCLRIIDYIEDIFVEKYISHTNSEIWENMKKIELKFISQTGKNSINDLKIFGLSDKEKITKMRMNVLNRPDDAMFFA